jgi:hypothetical protein
MESQNPPTNCQFYGKELPMFDGPNCHTCDLAKACAAAYEAGQDSPVWGDEIPFDGSPLPSMQPVARPLVARARVAEMMEGSRA